MSDRDMLKALVQKAINNEWKWKDFQGGYFPTYLGDRIAEHIATTMDDMRLYCLIFNKEFAKRLFTDISHYELVCDKCSGTYNWWDGAETKRLGFSPSKYCTADGTRLKKRVAYTTSPSEYHLREAVVSDNPIKYLYKHAIEEKK